MSEMSYLEKLLDGVEVEWLPLGKLGELVRGNGLPKSDFTESGVPAIHYGQIYTFYGLSTETTKSFVSHETAKKLKKVNSGDVVITNTSENFTDVGKALVYLGKEQAVTGGHATIFKPNSTIIGKYFAYFTQTDSFANEKRKYSKGTKVIDVSASDMAKIIIPIPCPDNPEKSLAIQSEIVRILDKFTALTAELTAELTMRKKQYNYYRDKLLSFEEGGVEWKTLGEIVKMRAGQHISARNIVDGKEGDFVYPCFGGNGIRGYVKEKSHDGEHLLIGRQGALCGNVQRMKGQFYATEHAVVVSAMQGIDIDWAFHMLTTMNLNQYASKSAQPGLAVGKLQELKLLVPSIERQKYIAKILDKFDTLTSSITEGLPREIELRQKQYEYYRDLLFSFPKPETASN
ncbi:restriction endonuclease subunit S [Escherichia coli]|mgnify:FL=1|uniref:restriction endonuclease subunit S n=1 Tax=Escherichia coli TaxID=562 RepID=UPI0012C4E3E1|nr:restriction endonuclease subunit S [Escherichia coli]EBH8347704.1 restriction endonuclease subunit S [Salmonella enterica subsp. enterica serovar Mbandaka]EBX3942258.1 restriction endonuclease subunit S [Salmonella enterica subsp. enterica serovar Tennessee]EDL3667810.1 restriction endonuclease subunit S [Salmonella enterica subsp. enterica serovar Kentucky]EDI7416846.1 restriction endonuclease subunit S [Salmonella enterica subsp. enterica serovar Mbandaka]EDU8305512.1 restriction endonucl